MSSRRLAKRIRRIVGTTAVVLLSVCWISVRAQTSLPAKAPPSSQPTPDEKHNDDVDFGMREDDARTRLALKAEKKAYEEHVSRAKEALEIAEGLKRTYQTAKVLNAADQKKLERLEKLTRRIRNEVGGSQGEADPKDLPKTFEEGVSQLADEAKELCDRVEKTPRRVVSTSIIDQANKLIALIEYLRGTRD
jgi:hypothetical protein